ncbi:hypothetical protein SAMN05444955_10613 [Lihuaxuella thermophila]|uniref:Uncharacterized protein n=1 Tax=Lihuaxuella thermophila TaxID=1173111 RepID=A0A1H8DWB5_9BACL|nr:hypothetical protein SAMN05444955_10613 [Lihuaxuella thermophila]
MGCKRKRKRHKFKRCFRPKKHCRDFHDRCDKKEKDCKDFKEKKEFKEDNDCCVKAFVVQTGPEICGSVSGVTNTFVTTNTNLGDPTAFGCESDRNAVSNFG